MVGRALTKIERIGLVAVGNFVTDGDARNRFHFQVQVHHAHRRRGQRMRDVVIVVAVHIQAAGVGASCKADRTATARVTLPLRLRFGGDAADCCRTGSRACSSQELTTGRTRARLRFFDNIVL